MLRYVTERKWKPQTKPKRKPTVKATCHNSSSSPWTPCSAGSCGIGVSTRVIRTTKGCNQMSNLRLCENHKCDDNKYRSYHQPSNINNNQKNSVSSNSRKWSNRHRTRVSEIYTTINPIYIMWWWFIILTFLSIFFVLWSTERTRVQKFT